MSWLIFYWITAAVVSRALHLKWERKLHVVSVDFLWGLSHLNKVCRLIRQNQYLYYLTTLSLIQITIICIMSLVSKRCIVHYVAAFGIAFASLAPAIAQGLAFGQTGSGFAIEICTSTGTKIIEQVNEETTANTAESCPYCTTHQPISTPLGEQLQFAPPEQLALYPTLFYCAPKPLSAWVKHPSQAPPQFS